jgi:hypothetical protein
MHAIEIFQKISHHNHSMVSFNISTWSASFNHALPLVWRDQQQLSCIMAAIRVCKVDPTIQIPHLDFHFYSGFGKLDVVDITCLQCLVARVPDLDTQNLWAITDRSGNLARAIYLQDS